MNYTREYVTLMHFVKSVYAMQHYYHMFLLITRGKIGDFM